MQFPKELLYNYAFAETQWRRLRMCEHTLGLEITDTLLAELFHGRVFFVSDYVDLPIDDVFDIRIVTPDTEKIISLIGRVGTEKETSWWFYEDVDIIAAGTAQTIFNRDRNSDNTTETNVSYIQNTSIANANSDTAIATATQLMAGVSGAGQSSGSEVQDRFISLKRNTAYSLRFEAAVAGYVDYDLVFYERIDPGKG